MTKKEKQRLFGRFNKSEETMDEEYQDQTGDIEIPDDGSATMPYEEEEDFEGQLALDMYQTKDAIVIKSTIAGVRPADIDVSIEENVLTITGERMIEDEIKDKDYYLQECYWGEFSRSVELPDEFDAEGISAEIKDGILTVVVPKVEPAKPKKIQVKG